jgi:pimeloyl-ACP methyl ester carboxylesterase
MELFHRLKLQNGSLKVHFSNADFADLSFGEDDLFKAIQGHLYRPQDWTSLPLKIHRAYQAQDYAPLFATLKSENMISTGMYLSIVCQEDLPYDFDDAGSGTEVKTPFKRVLPDLKPFCELWLPGHSQRGLGRIDQPFPSEIPLLVLSGELDPVTPPAAGKNLLPHFTASTQLVFAQAGHNVIGSPCAQRIFKSFVADPNKFLSSQKGNEQKCEENSFPYRYFSTFYGFNL